MADDLLTTREAGALLARLKGRPGPYKPSTVRSWIRDLDLPTDAGDGERIYTRRSDLIDWAKRHGYLPNDYEDAEGKPQPEAAPVKVKPAATRPLKLVAEEPEDDELIDEPVDGEEDELEGDLEYGTCPQCGSEVAISADSVIVECPSCHTELEVMRTAEDEPADWDGEEAEEVEDDEDELREGEAPCPECGHGLPWWRRLLG